MIPAMMDTTPGARPHSQDTISGARLDVARTPTLSVVEAARVAGVNDRTIRRVIVDGKLTAAVEQGAYRINPDALAAWTATRAPRATPDVAPGTGAGAHPVAQGDDRPLVEVADVLAAKDETIAALNADVVFLRDQLDQARRDLAEAHRTAVVARELDAQRIETRLEALTAQIVDQRGDAPEASLEGPGRDEGSREGDPPTSTSASWWARTWRKVWGGG